MARFGNIGTQYFDNAGDPLANGKLYFFESGTSIDKDTFADVNLSILNQNPVLLSAAGRQPNIFFDGSARVVLTNSNDVQIEERDPAGAESAQGAFSEWNALEIYGSTDIVTASNGSYFVSISENNQGNNPLSSPASWSELELITIWNTNQIYGQGEIAIAGDGIIYVSKVGGNSGNDPATSPAQWANSIGDITGDWVPAVVGTTVPGTAAYVSRTGSYKKSGKWVTFQCQVSYAVHTGTGFITITGLPFLTKNITNYAPAFSIICSGLTVGAGLTVQAAAVANSNVIRIYSFDPATGTQAALAMDASANITINGTYEAE